MVQIHPTAIVERGAELGVDVVVGPYAVIGPKVVLEDKVVVHHHASILARTHVGAETEVFSFATLGSAPQDLKYHGEDTQLRIGKKNKIREYCNISIGTEGGGGITEIKDNNLLMVYCHVAHDCRIDSHCIFANSVNLAGHVVVDSYAVLGGVAAIHQFCHVGELAMVAGGAMVAQDVPPFCMVQGDRATINGLNVVGIKRAQFSSDVVSDIKKMFRLLYKENLRVEEVIERIEEEISQGRERDVFINFLRKSERGVCR